MGSLILGSGLSAVEGRGLSKSSFGLYVSLDLSYDTCPMVLPLLLFQLVLFYASPPSTLRIQGVTIQGRVGSSSVVLVNCKFTE